MSRFRLIPLAAAAALMFAAQADGQTSGSDLSQLRDALHLTTAQQASWRDFEAASQPDPEEQARQRSAEAMLPRLTSPQRVDLSLAVARADLETLERRGAALKTFYATLTPDQRAIFDRETAPRSPQQGP